MSDLANGWLACFLIAFLASFRAGRERKAKAEKSKASNVGYQAKPRGYWLICGFDRVDIGGKEGGPGWT